MKFTFAWVALEPPEHGTSPRWIPAAARLGALVALAGCILQLGLGWDQGWFGLTPLIASALLFGLPHGAIDHLIALGLARKTLKPASLLQVAGLYLMLSLLFALLWVLAPIIALIAFLLMTTYHWGSADTAFERTTDPGCRLSRSAVRRQVHTALRGLIPIGVPFLAFPTETSTFLQSCTELFGAPAPNLEVGRWAIGSLLPILFIADLLGRLRDKSAPGFERSFESLGLYAFFFFVPPLVAIGWYFCLWHGLRHVLRLCRYHPKEVELFDARHPIRIFFLRALPFTLLSLGFLWVAARFLPVDADPDRWVALYLVLISTLTFPHMLLVAWMDRRELD